MIENKEIIANLLIQLGNVLKEDIGVATLEVASPSSESKKYLTRKEVLEEYYPVITSYGLSQAIHMEGFPCIKRGKKYFFVKEDIDTWLRKRTNVSAISRTTKYV